MREMLKAMFDEDERRAAGVLGESTDLSLKDKVHELFQQLTDPLLSAEDIAELLGGPLSPSDVQTAVQELAAEGSLEASSTTQRALDPANITLYRRPDVPFQRLVLTAIESRLAEEQSRFQFTCNGRLIRSLAKIDRLDAIQGTGQQRAEIRRHVERIADGIAAGTPVPNPILLVLLEEKTYFDEESDTDGEEAPESFAVVRPLQEWMEVDDPFSSAADVAQRMRLVDLDLPFRHAAFDEEKCALLVDGQQRTAALAMVPVEDRAIVDLSVSLMVTDSPSAAKVFTVANSTQKIATDFSRALLATMPEAPEYLRDEQTVAAACRVLALVDSDSPFFDIVKYPGYRAKPTHVVAYNTLFHVVTAFEGAALPTDGDPAKLADLVKRAFLTVKATWPEAWGVKVTGDARLMHGASLRALAGLLIAKTAAKREAGQDLSSPDVWEGIAESLERLVPRLAWTTADALAGTATAKHNFDENIQPRQNTSQDIQKLQRFLNHQSMEADEEAREEAA